MRFYADTLCTHPPRSLLIALPWFDGNAPRSLGVLLRARSRKAEAAAAETSSTELLLPGPSLSSSWGKSSASAHFPAACSARWRYGRADTMNPESFRD